jgi:tRNA (cmo5U34)-methyltransferase
MSQFHFDPDTYMDMIRADVPGYDRLQDALAAAASATPAHRMLDLGTGTGVTARRVLDVHPEATLVGVDESAGMLAEARRALPPVTDLRVARLEETLPDGPFDLVVSALAVHHLDGPGKAGLFRRVAEVLRPGGRFVMADVVVPDDPADAVVPLEEGFDVPDRVPDLLGWLAAAGFDARVTWAERDLAVVAADLPDGPAS